MPKPRKAYREWEPKDLGKLLEDPVAEEGNSLDFKKQCNLFHANAEAREKARKNILKDICAMANGAGGAVFIGVDESRRTDAPPVANELCGMPSSEVQKLRETILDLADDHLDARPAPLEILAVALPDSPDKSVLIVHVPQNTHSLSMITFHGLYQFWVRRGWNNRRMTTMEIEHAFDRIAKARASAEEELDRTVKGLLPGNTVPFAWFVAVPLDRSRNHVPVKREPIAEMLVESPYNAEIVTAGPYVTPAELGQGSLVPCLEGLQLRRPDGRLFFRITREGAVVLRWRPHEEWDDGDISPRSVYAVWATGWAVVRELQDKFGVGESVLAQAGLANCQRKKLSDRGLPQDGILPLAKIFLDETHDRKRVLTEWAIHLANAAGKPDPELWPGWVGAV